MTLIFNKPLVLGKEKAYSPEAFTVTGAPSITEEGIASDFSTGNYITVNPGINATSKNYEIDVKLKKTSLQCVILSSTVKNAGNQAMALICANAQPQLILYLGSGINTGWNIGAKKGISVLQSNVDYTAKIIRMPEKYVVRLLNHNTGVETKEIEITSETDTGSLANLYLGTGSYWPELGHPKYDLKEVKTYENGEEVFKGTKLVIPEWKAQPFAFFPQGAVQL